MKEEDTHFKEMKDLFFKIKDKYEYDNSYHLLGDESIFFKENLRDEKESIGGHFIPIESAIQILDDKYFYKESPLNNDPDVENYTGIKKKGQNLILQYQDLSISYGSSFIILEDILIYLGLCEYPFFSGIEGIELYRRSLSLPLSEKEKLSEVFKNRSKLINTNMIELISKQLSRLHIGIVNNVGRNLLSEQIILKYKARCEIYDKKRVVEIIENERQNHKSKKEIEKVLCKDMAAYFFDNGLPVFSEVIAEDFRFDVFSNYKKDSTLLIEAKQYNKSVSENDVLSWYDQIFNYMNVVFNSIYQVKIGFLVIFRVDGPLYNLPEQVTIGKFTVRTVLINLGPREGGQSIINREQIKNKIENK